MAFGIVPIFGYDNSTCRRREKYPCSYMGYDAVPHGFRSTFRGVSAEETDFTDEVKRTAMAHAHGDKLDEAYWRTDVFRKRKRLMQEWADFIDNPPEYYKTNVIPINATAAA